MHLLKDKKMQMYLNEYMQNLEQNLELKKGRRNGVMAVRDETKRLIKKLFEENKEIFTAVIKYAADDEEDDDIKKKMLEIANDLHEKDFTKYVFNGQKNLAKSRLVLNVIKKFIIDQNPTVKELENKFNNLGHNLPVIYMSNKELKGDKLKRYYTKNDERIHIDDKILYVTNQWGKGEVFDRFLMLAQNELNYNITEM
jgi:hypothetical protein